MRSAGLLIGFLGVTLFVLPALTAQDKKDDPKADKKEAKDKKDDAKADKKDDKKDKDEPEKKEPAKDKEKKKVEQIPEHGNVLRTTIASMKPDAARDFEINISVPDPEQLWSMKMQQAQHMQSIANAQNAQQYAQRVQALQNLLAQWAASGTGYTKKPMPVRATESCKVRTMFPPVQYDDAGNLKKWTRKELDALKANSKLPGFPSDFDMLKPGQFVEVYFVKPPKEERKPGAGAGAAKKKKGDEDPPDPMMNRPEIVLIVIISEPMR
jgi:hypothetical protein